MTGQNISKRLKKEEIVALFECLKAENPKPVTELNAPNPYCLLLAIVFSAQATDAGVNKATKTLFEKVQTPQALLALGEEGLKSHIKTIGLFNSKAKNALLLSKMLVEEFDGHIPVDRDLLVKLPGVGRKTANVWLNCVHGHHTMAVDTHVFRVGNRLGLCHAKDVVAAEKALLKVIPETYMQYAHHWLILLGRYTCKARKPECVRCAVRDICGYKAKLL